MKSLWVEQSEKTDFPSLNTSIKTDVLIIGAGIAGILCAYELKKAGIDCVIAEAKTICGGVTCNTTAKVTYHHGAIFDKMVKRFGEEKGALYFKSQKEAFCKLKNLCETIDCDFRQKDSFVYSLDNKSKIEKEIIALNKIGCEASLCENLPLPFSVAGAVCVKNQGQFNPLKFLYVIAKDLNIYENTKVIEVTPEGAVTNKGKIKAEKIIVATHFPFINKYGGYSFKMYQHRSYVIALENGKDVDGMYIDEADKGFSFRNYGDLLLLGGGDHRTGKKGGNWQELRRFAAKNYKDSKVLYYWATQDCITVDDLPYIGKYSGKTPELFVATGFNKWGMTSSMVAAGLLKDLVQGKENEYAALYSPSRSVLRPQFFLNGLETALSLLTPTVPRCPHLGCALKYNKAEHSWDCPCHGSRFEENGRLIDNPATDDKKMR